MFLLRVSPAPKAAPAATLDKREAGYYPEYDPNGARPKDPSGLDPPIMRGPDPPDRNLHLGEYVPDNRWARPAMPGPQIGIRWLADTGCPFDLVGVHDIPTQDHRHIKTGRIQHALQTANGVAGTQGRVDATVESLDEDIEAFVMGNIDRT